MRIGAVVVAFALLLAACDGDERPTASPSPPVTSASASLTPAAEAEAAVRAYYAATSAAYANGQVAGLRALSTATCPCRSVVSSIEQSWASGSLRGGVYTVRAARVDGITDTGATVTVTYDLTSLEELDRSGRVIRSAPPLQGASAQVDLVRQAGRWLVARITRLGSSS